MTAQASPAYLQEMIALAKHAMENAYAPYSKFHVGCCLRSATGHFYTGANVENAAYPSSQCAEASALGNLITAGDRVITDVVVLSGEVEHCPPCGNCRQKLSEFITPDTKIHFCTPTHWLETHSVYSLLPYMFKHHLR
ncbi:MAG: cytidine deaminase [Gammaproteobacteria bacterium]|nr:cytidine deaminase [Gammaproteobacteria bacterium]